MAFDVREVESSMVMAGGVTAANFPQVFKNSRRSSSSEGIGSILLLLKTVARGLNIIELINLKVFNKFPARTVSSY